MRRFAVLAAGLILGCGAAQSDVPNAPQVTPEAISQTSELRTQTQAQAQSQALSSPVALPESAPVQTAEMPLRVHISCTGVFSQGGAALCQTSPNAKVKIARSEKDFYYESADETGQILVGFDRDETGGFVEVGDDRGLRGDHSRFDFNLAPREYSISRIDGLPPSQVSTYSAEQLKHIRASSAKKAVGFGSRSDLLAFVNGFSYPLKEFVKTSPFGAQRILNGEPKSPHYGVDIAAPVGTPIYAPAGGTVVLSDDDLYFEGAMVMIDHGQGFTSMYLHVSEIFVEDGQVIQEGDKIAAVGSEGRSTGPHLCWRLKWRNRNLDPELLTQWPGRG